MLTFIISKKLDINKLNSDICDFEQRYGWRPYIFANEETLTELHDQITIPYTNISDKLSDKLADKLVNTRGIVALYNGYKVYLNQFLEYGEVDLR